MTTPTFSTPDGSYRFAPVGQPIQNDGQQILRAFVEHAPSTGAFKLGDEVALRAPVYQDRWAPAQRQERRDLQHAELDAIRLLHPQLHAELLTIEIEGTPEAREQVVAHLWIKGDTLERTIQAHFPQGAPLDIGLLWARDIAQGLATLHEHRLIHRHLSPKHILIDDQQRARVIGFASIQGRQARPSTLIRGVDERYSAPEIIRELSGTFVTPKADIYSFGGVLAFLFSGQPLTDSVEAPVSFDAWSTLGQHPDGIRLLVAHCMQPFHKNRLVNGEALLPLLANADALPTKYTKNFGAIFLAAPWTGSGEESRVGDLSPGPLVSRGDRLASALPSEAQPDDAVPSDAPMLGSQSSGASSETSHEQEAPVTADAAGGATDAFWNRPAPGEPTSDTLRQELPSNAPFFAKRGISPLAIAFGAIWLALAIVLLAGLFR